MPGISRPTCSTRDTRVKGQPVQIIFDGYSKGPSTKDQEHVQRVTKSTSMASTHQLSNDSTQLGSQEAFLANTENKIQFISLLMKYLQEAIIHVQQVVGDAETSIVQEAITRWTQSKKFTLCLKASILMVH